MAALTALRSGLQEEVFDPSDEKLFAFTNVSRAGKKRKPSFLCIAGRSLKTCKRDNVDILNYYVLTLPIQC